jgi:uncharacterized RDD family membrane protein YckC
MAIVKVLTANNVEIEYEVAGIGDRALATLIDWVIMFAYALIIFKIIDSTTLQYDLSITMQVLFYLPVFLYHLLCELFMEGQSFGKKAMGIRVVMMDAGRPGFVNYFLRWIITPLEFVIGFGVIALLACAANGKGQRLADMAAGTTVIRLKPRATIKETLFVKQMDPDYVVHFNEVMNLTDKDMNLIKQVQRQIYKKGYNDAHYFAEETKKSICRKLNIESDMEGIAFIETILKDYQKMAAMQL